MRLFNMQSSIRLGRKKTLGEKFLENLPLFVLAAPALLYFIVFHYLPMFGLIIAFKDYSYAEGIFRSPWIGFDNFKYFFMSQDVWRITRNTVGYGALFIVTNVLSATIVALLLFEVKNRAAIKTYQTIMILPNFLSWVVVGFITYILLNPTMGIVNQFIRFLGMDGKDWYSEPAYWPFILTIVNTWKGVGMNTIIYYAALMGVSQEMFEAATIEGANRFQKARYISLPALIPLMTMLSILAVGNIFRGDFGLFYQIPRDVGALYPTTDVIDTYIYRGLRSGDVGVTTAVGFFQSFVGVVLVVVTNAIVKKIEPDNAMF